MPDDPRRLVPRTDALLADPRLAAATERLGRPALTQLVRAQQQQVRDGRLAPDAVVDAVLTQARTAGLHRVINATGVVLHTNLGRAPLSDPARAAIAEAAGYVDVEFDLERGTRAPRGRGALEAVLRAVPAAQAAMVVNNGAAALVLATTALGAGREIVVSRGELVEIGDGFRLPDLIASTGARLREVGTTNRTTRQDYADALGPDTGAVLKVHPSNFRISGYTSGVAVAELATLGPPVIVDIGSGLLAPDRVLPDEPDAAAALEAGASVVTSSGDKLLGGPQAGLLLGRTDVIARLRRHPLARALRVDKLTLAALAATLTGPPAPTARYLHADPGQLQARALALAEVVGGQAVASDGAVGGGGAPGVALPGWAVALPQALAAPLRTGRPPVVGRVHDGRCLLDLRCVEPADDAVLADAVRAATAAG